jgi:hypothetical protein
MADAWSGGASGSTKQAIPRGSRGAVTVNVTGRPGSMSSGGRRVTISPSCACSGGASVRPRTTTSGGRHTARSAVSSNV